MSGIYQKQTNSGSVASPSAGRTLISVNESGELFTKDSSGAVTVYGSGSGGGGGAAFPFTGSADISGTLNVDFTDALSFITNDNILFSPIARLSDGEGGWVDLSFSGSVLGSIITGSNYVIRDYVGDGDIIVPAIGSFPTRLSAQTLIIPHISGSGYSGSVSGRIVGVFDQTALGGTILSNFGDEFTWTADDGTIHQFSTAFVGDTDGTWDVQKQNNAGEIIKLILEADNTGFILENGLSDTSASLLDIQNSDGNRVMQFFQHHVVSEEIGSLNYANDIDAEAGGVPLNGIYNNAGALRIRLT
jgi:hypothetical protein